MLSFGSLFGPSARASWWFTCAVLCLLGSLHLLPGIWSMPLVDRDEPRFAQATREMIQRSDPFIPTFNGDYRFDKPPLTYWSMALFYGLFGRSEWSARLHTVVATILVALALAAWARRLYSPSAGMLAGVSWLSSLQVLAHGRLAVADMPMVLGVVLAMRAIHEILLAGSSGESPGTARRWGWFLWLALALGFLAKGPVALLVPALALALFRILFWRRSLDWRRFRPISGPLLCLGLIGAWGIPALLMTRGAFWDVGIGHHVVDRGVESFNNRIVLPFYYLGTFFLSLLPWAGFLGPAISHARRSYRQESALFLSWLIAPFLIFAFYATQLPHYTMPGFPAFCLLLAGTWHHGKLNPSAWSPRIYWALTGLLLLAIGGLAAWAPLPAGYTAVRWIFASMLGLMGGAWLFGLGFALRRLALMVLGSLVIAVGGFFLGQQFNHLVVTKQMAPRLQELPAGLARGWVFSEPGLVFYSSLHWEFFDDEVPLEQVVSSPGDQPQPDALVFLREEHQFDDALRSLFRRDRPYQATNDFNALLDDLELPGYERTQYSGINYARSSWAKVDLYIRTQGPQ